MSAQGSFIKKPFIINDGRVLHKNLKWITTDILTETTGMENRKAQFKAGENRRLPKAERKNRRGRTEERRAPWWMWDRIKAASSL